MHAHDVFAGQECIRCLATSLVVSWLSLETARKDASATCVHLQPSLSTRREICLSASFTRHKDRRQRTCTDRARAHVSALLLIVLYARTTRATCSRHSEPKRRVGECWQGGRVALPRLRARTLRSCSLVTARSREVITLDVHDAIR